MTRLGDYWRYLRHHGVMATIRAIIGRVYHSHRCVITWKLLSGAPALDHVGDVVFRLATPTDLDRLDELERYGRGSTHRTYVQRDSDWLFVGCHGDRIVATRRMTRVVRDPLIARVLQLGPGQVWGADVFCLPEYRNQGIGRHLMNFSDRFVASLGFTEVLSTIVIGNTPSLRATLGSGNQLLYYVSYIRVSFYERLRVSKDIPRHLVEGPASR